MAEREIQGVIFDMDGLLVDTEKLYNRFWREAAHDFGYEMTYADALSIRSLTPAYAAELLKKRFDSAFPYDAIKEHRRVIMQEYIDREGVEPKKGAAQLLEYLKDHDYRTALATASPLRRAKRYLDSIGIWEYFDVKVGGEEVHLGKPEPEIYLTAARKLGLNPEQCIALEDSPNGIMSASGAGCRPVMVPDLDEPDAQTGKLLYACVPSLEEVITLLKV